jgi:hypothetical protein
MPIEKKPEQIVLSGDEARQAIIDGVQHKLNRRIDEKTIVVALNTNGDPFVTVDVIGSLKGVKPGTKRGPRKPKTPPASAA